MPTQTTSCRARLGDVLDSLGDLTGHAAELEKFVTSTLRAISDWHDEIDRREAEVRDRENELAGQSQRLESEQQRIEQWADDCQRRADELVDEQSQFEQRREELDRQLADATAEVTLLREQMAAANAADGCTSERVMKLEQERQALEEELELVRQRAAALVETADEERRDFESQKSLWMRDMKELRRSLEVNAPTPAQPEVTANTVPAAAAPVNKAPRDTALDSVMAQFEMLQRDLARRGTNQNRKSKPRQQEVA
ncbi:MAG: hypothetical protein R3C10_08630 [Pirellulales bacterium]